MSTDVEVRRSLDLTRAPTEQWNEEMMALVASQVLKRASTRGEQIYCLSVADALALNPFIGEIYFIPSKSKDGSGPGILPYIGRNGLVKKATERGAYYEAETVHEQDRFRMTRKRDGTVEVTHSYGNKDRGAIVGAYAFLHFRNGDRPAFFYAKLEEYLPSFDAEWKMHASPWGNQRSAMIEKCAMIGAGRKRLNLGNVLADGEIARVQQMGETGPATAAAVEAGSTEFDWEGGELSGMPADVIARLRAAVERANGLVPLSWPAAKLEMVFAGRTADELAALAAQIEQEADTLASRAEAAAPGPVDESAGDSSPEPDGEVTDAEVVPDAQAAREHADALRTRMAMLEARIEGAEPDSEEFSELSAELDQVGGELAAAEDPDQTSLGL